MRRQLFLLLAFLCTVNLFSLSFHQLNVENGLSSRQVYQIEKDSRGYVWIFNAMGVERFDGTELKQYKLEGLLESKDHVLSSTTMVCDRSGNIWIATRNGSIYFYDSENDCFELQSDVRKLIPQATDLHSIYFDSKNRLWLCTSVGLFLYNRNEGEAIPSTNYQGENVLRILQGADNDFYVGVDNTLSYFLEKKENEFSQSKRIGDEIGRIESMCILKGSLYVGTFSSGAYVVDIASKSIVSLSSLIPSIPIRAIDSFGEDEIWFGTDGSGLYILDHNSQLLRRKIHSGDNSNLSGNTISDILIDEDGRVWVSTSTNGINIYDNLLVELTWIKHEQKNMNSLIENHVNVIFEDADGDMWYGTNSGVSLYQRKEKRWRHFLNGDLSRVVLAIGQSADRTIWVGGYGIGLYHINKTTGSTKKVSQDILNGNVEMPLDYIFSIKADENTVWIGGIEGELTYYDISKSKYYSLPISCIGDIEVNDNTNLWLAGCAGLGMLNKATKEVIWKNTFDGYTLSYPIRGLVKTLSGDIWMATDGEGLIYYNPRTDESKVFTSKNSNLSTNAINGIVEDKLGRIWATSEKELYCIENRGNSIICMNDYLGIKWGYFNPNSCLLKSNGNIAFGTARGVVEFSPEFDFELLDSISVIFTDFKLQYESVKAGTKDSSLPKAIDNVGHIGLEYEQNSFSLNFSAINFTHPYQAEFQYKLEGYDDNWIVSTSRSAQYMNVPSGKYVFQVRVVNRFNEQVIGLRSIDMHIGLPFWRSWWAIVGYLMVSAILVYLSIQFIRNRIVRHDARERIRFFISVAHDIRTPISLIKAPLSEIETKEALTKHGKELLTIAKDNTEKLFVMVSQLLDLQKVELNSEKLSVERHYISVYVRDKIMSFQPSANEKGITLDLHLQPNFPEIWFDANKMDKVVNNLLSNAIKYTQRGSIDVELEYTNKEWIFCVKDTGIGIPVNEQKHLFKDFYRAENAINSNESGSGIGLILVHRLVKLMNGYISFSSEENVGTTFIIRFPLDENYISDNIDQIIDSLDATPQNEEVVLLLAEDNPDLLKYLQESLSHNYKVITTTNGEELLQKAKEINPDLIISDVLMPKLRGDEVCRQLKSSIDTSHIPFILLSALSEKENVILGLESGANDYIIKPFDFNILEARIRNILQSRELLRKQILSAQTGLEDLDYTNRMDKEFLEKVIQTIEENLSNVDFTIDELCSIMAMSRTSIYNKMKTLTNQSPNDFIRIIRLNKAKELLRTRKHTIAEVSYIVGFSDPKYFSTSFKKQFNVSPSKFE